MKKHNMLLLIMAICMVGSGCSETNVTATSMETGGEEYVKIEEKISDVEKDLPMDMSDAEIGIAIHHMSHQKVIAATKWGEMPLTQERVARLIEILKSKDFENETTYFAILNRWSEENFNNVMQEHNLIWNMQGGTVGEATGTMSHDGERLFIEKHFDVNN